MPTWRRFDSSSLHVLRRESNAGTRSYRAAARVLKGITLYPRAAQAPAHAAPRHPGMLRMRFGTLCPSGRGCTPVAGTACSGPFTNGCCVLLRYSALSRLDCATAGHSGPHWYALLRAGRAPVGRRTSGEARTLGAGSGFGSRCAAGSRRLPTSPAASPPATRPLQRGRIRASDCRRGRRGVRPARNGRLAACTATTAAGEVGSRPVRWGVGVRVLVRSRGRLWHSRAIRDRAETKLNIAEACL